MLKRNTINMSKNRKVHQKKRSIVHQHDEQPNVQDQDLPQLTPFQLMKQKIRTGKLKLSQMKLKQLSDFKMMLFLNKDEDYQQFSKEYQQKKSITPTKSQKSTNQMLANALIVACLTGIIAGIYTISQFYEKQGTWIKWILIAFLIVIIGLLCYGVFYAFKRRNIHCYQELYNEKD